MIWFTSDEHLGHKAVIRHCDRPWKSVDKMSSDITKNLNSAVKTGDTVYHLGDWCWFGPDRRMYHENKFAKYKEGITHHLILGNHDRLNPFTYVEIGFSTVHTAMWETWDDTQFVMCHDPAVYDVVKDKSILLCGHIHGLFKHMLPASKVINVGVDVWDFKPVSLDQIFELLKQQKFIS